MTLKTLSDLNLKNKRVLLRVDLNCAVFNGKIIESDRIKAHSKTIKELVKKKAKVIVLAHQGQQEKEDFISLRQHSRILNKYVKVKFVNEVIGKRSWAAISKLKNGEALLLENVRFLKDEFKPSLNNSFVNFMKEAGFDYYVNDAFSVSHRNQTSIVSFPKVFSSAVGPVFKKELENIEKLKSKIKNCLFILGGKKSEDIILLLKNKKILTGGELSLLSLISKGHNLGKENKILKKRFKLLPKIRKYSKNLINPIDLAVSVKGNRKVLNLKDFPQNYLVLDIGDKTIELYKKEIKKAKAIFFKGAMGMFEDPRFSKGTREILKAISNSNSFSVIAGGQSSDALEKFKISKKKFGYVSLSGGALVKYIAGEKLVGLTALQ